MVSKLPTLDFSEIIENQEKPIVNELLQRMLQQEKPSQT
jgi:hypothetical protein